MNRTRRGLLLGATGGLGVVSLVAACGGQEATRTRAPEPGQKDELTWLIIYGDYSPRKDAYDAMQRRFNEGLADLDRQLNAVLQRR